jgi:hypothetical protein
MYMIVECSWRKDSRAVNWAVSVMVSSRMSWHQSQGNGPFYMGCENQVMLLQSSF